MPRRCVRTARQVEAGLLVVREEGSEPRPRFRNRLMFPIYDSQNRVVAFGGRVIGEGEPKYLNSAESPVFVKGATLYGLNWARNALRRDDRALLVEGYFDCIRLVAAGVESTVAPLGTALTEPQAELIRKYTKTVFLLYDSDKAGLKATFRAGDVLLRQGMKVHVVTLPDGEDPDTFVQKHGRDRLEAQLAHAIDVFERKIQILQRGGWFADLRRKRVALDRLFPTIRAATDPISRELYVARAAEVVGVREDVLLRELQEGRSRPSKEPGAGSSRAAEAPKRPEERRKSYLSTGARAERELVRVLLHRRQYADIIREKVRSERFRDPQFSQIFARLIGAPEDNIEALVMHLDEASVAVLNDLSNDDGGLELPARVIDDCVSRLRQRDLSEEIAAIDRERSLASEAEKDRLNARKHQLIAEMNALGPQRWQAFERRP
jgi:DNA primase